MKKPPFTIIQIIGQMLFYLPFACAIGYFSTSPAYTHFDPGKAMIKLSFNHTAHRVKECRRRSAEEIAKLAPNMRRPMDCPRERLPVVIELALDGEVIFHRSLSASGLSNDGAASLYERFTVSQGTHHLAVRLKDSDRAQGYDYERDEEINLREGQSFTIDFRAESGGFIFM